MSEKYLEALDDLEKINDYLNNVYDYKEIKEEIQKDINNIKQAILELKAIENANLSKALECLEKFFNSRKIYEPNNTYIFECITCLNSIKQLLIKSQEQEKENAEYEKVLKLVFDRKVDIYHLSKSKTVEDYNSIWDSSTYCLTEEEFDLLKRYRNG